MRGSLSRSSRQGIITGALEILHDCVKVMRTGDCMLPFISPGAEPPATVSMDEAAAEWDDDINASISGAPVRLPPLAAGEGMSHERRRHRDDSHERRLRSVSHTPHAVDPESARGSRHSVVSDESTGVTRERRVVFASAVVECRDVSTTCRVPRVTALSMCHARDITADGPRPRPREA